VNVNQNLFLNNVDEDNLPEAITSLSTIIPLDPNGDSEHLLSVGGFNGFTHLSAVRQLSPDSSQWIDLPVKIKLGKVSLVRL
jgi:hypothetical protein